MLTDFCKIYRDILAVDTEYQSWLSSTDQVWGDEIEIETYTEADLRKFKAEQAEYFKTKKQADDAQLELERQEFEKRQAEIDEEVEYQKATEASEIYWSIHHCTCTHEMVDSLPTGSDVPCLCYQRIKLDENGEPQECRFFNSPCGCRDGEKCFYKHVERNPAEIPCRFEESDAGCNPGFGKTCPYKHTKPQTMIDYSTVICRFDGRCNPRSGVICPYKHTIPIRGFRQLRR